jgi:DNA-directed RNA polymerase subunit RPC12/RpoP
MALVKCKECGQEVSTSAGTCPHCGKKRTTTRTKVIAAGIVLLATLGIIGNALDEGSRKPVAMPAAEKKAKTKLDAQIMCKLFVERFLHDPDSAEFESVTTFPVVEDGDEYVVTVRLRARNGFNALRAGSFVCRTKSAEGDKWNLLGLQEVRH